MTSVENQIPIVKLTTGPLDYNQVERSILGFLNTIRDNIDSEDFVNFKHDLLTSNFELNVVTNAKSGMKYGFAWLWVSSMSLFHLLCGKNADGTPAFTKEISSNWTPPNLGFDINDYNIEIEGPARKLFIEKGYNFKSWSDAGDFRDMIEDMTKQEEIIIPRSIINLPPVELTEEQCHEIKVVYNKNSDIPKYFEIKVDPAYFKKDENYTLISRNIPSWVTEEILYHHFVKFNTDPNIYKHKILLPSGENKIIDSKFPIIRFKPNYLEKTTKDTSFKTVYIQFSKSNPWDAKAAEMMKKQLKIKDNNGDVHNLIFFIQNNEQLKSSSSVLPPKFQK